MRASGGSSGQGGPDHLPTLEETAAAVIRASGQAGQPMAAVLIAGTNTVLYALAGRAAYLAAGRRFARESDPPVVPRAVRP